jgi:hypothetical protein
MSSENPSHALDRVRFKNGQRLTPESLNSISDFSLARQELFAQMFIGTSGVIEGFLDGLKVTLSKETPLTIQVSTGAAIDIRGKLLVLDEPTFLNLKGITVNDDALLFIELIGHEVFSETPTGLTALRSVCRLQATNHLSPGGIEIARVRLSPKTVALNLVSTLTNLETPTDTIDTRFTRRLKITLREYFSFEEHYLIRKSLSDIAACFLQIETLYKDLSQINKFSHVLIVLRSQTAGPNFPRESVSFLLVELSHLLLDILETIRDSHVAEQKPLGDFWSPLFELCEQIKIQASPLTIAPFRSLTSIVQLLREKLLLTSIEKERVTMIREGLLSLREGPFTSFEKHALGGTLFNIVSHWDHNSLKEKSKVETQFDTLKTLSSQYPDGTVFKGTGRFYSEGKITLPLESTLNTGDGILFLQLYKRRGIKEFALSINGQNFHKEILAASDFVDKVLNIGAFIPYEFIRPGLNEIVLDIRRVDFDFGLLGVWFYQSEKPVGKGDSNT